MDFDGWSKSDFEHDYVELMNSFANQYPTASGRIRSMGPQVGKLRPEDKDFMLKFLQLKYSILYLQQRKVFGKYCFYGCWCLPRGAAQIGIGHGAPVDNIDQSCKEFSTCHSCLYNTQYGKGCNESSEVKYKVSGRVEVATGKKYLMCSKYQDYSVSKGLNQSDWCIIVFFSGSTKYMQPNEMWMWQGTCRKASNTWKWMEYWSSPSMGSKSFWLRAKDSYKRLLDTNIKYVIQYESFWKIWYL